MAIKGGISASTVAVAFGVFFWMESHYAIAATEQKNDLNQDLLFIEMRIDIVEDRLDREVSDKKRDKYERQIRRLESQQKIYKEKLIDLQGVDK